MLTVFQLARHAPVPLTLLVRLVLPQITVTTDNAWRPARVALLLTLLNAFPAMFPATHAVEIKQTNV